MMGAPENYEAPFCPTTQQNQPCVCICCGRHEPAAKCISEYPFRYIPASWSSSAKRKGLRCGICTRGMKVHPEFYLNNEVWISTEVDKYGGHSGDTGVTYHIVKVPNMRPHIEVRNAPHQPIYTDVQVASPEEPMEVEHEEPAPAPRATTKAKLKKQASAIGGAAALGVKLALVNEAGDTMVDIAKELAKDMPMLQLALEHPDGREIAKLLVAVSVHTVATHTGIVPKAEFVGSAAELQMTASSMALLAPRLKSLRKHFLKLAEVGEQIAQLGEGAPSERLGFEEPEEAEAVSPRKKVKAAGKRATA